MSIAHGFMSILIHRAQFMSIARMSYAHILGTMYELCSYYDQWLYHRRAMLYHIIYDLYHDPYPRAQLDDRDTPSDLLSASAKPSSIGLSALDLNLSTSQTSSTAPSETWPW